MSRTRTKTRVVPEGYRAATWDQVQTDTLVYRYDHADKLIPYVVVDPNTQMVRAVISTSAETIEDETLLVKNGPLVIIVISNGRFVGLYSDLSVEVLLFKGQDYTVVRPKIIDALPAVQQATLNSERPSPLWPCAYGQWEIVSTKPDESSKDEFTFEVTNRLAAFALASEMLRVGYPYKVEPNKMPPTYWSFTVSRKVLGQLQKDFERLLGGDPHVTK